MAMGTFGLSALMEAVNQGQKKSDASVALMEAMDDVIDDDIVAAVTGQEDDLESDMDGDGVGNDEEMEKLLDRIPPSDNMDEEELESMTESFFDGDAGEATF